MQKVEFIISEKDLDGYVKWAKNNAINGVKIKEFEFNEVIFVDASHISLVKNDTYGTTYTARIYCDYIKTKGT